MRAEIKNRAVSLSEQRRTYRLTELKASSRTFKHGRVAAAKQIDNRKDSVAVIYNAVFVRSEADSNRCMWFCRPVPNPSAIRPFRSAKIAIKMVYPNSGALLFVFLPLKNHASFSNSERRLTCSFIIECSFSTGTRLCCMLSLWRTVTVPSSRLW